MKPKSTSEYGDGDSMAYSADVSFESASPPGSDLGESVK